MKRKRYSKQFQKDIEDYVGLINSRLVDISYNIQDLSIVLKELGKILGSEDETKK